MSDITLMITRLLVVLCAGAAAGTVATVLARVDLRASTRSRALAAYQAAPPAEQARLEINTALGLVQPAYSPFISIGVVAGALVGLLALGLPFVPALGGAALAYILAAEFLKGQVRKVRLGIEQELPTFVSRLGGMLLVTNAPRQALEEVTGTLLEGRPLRIWLEQLLAQWSAGGDSVLATAHLEANRISPLLGLTVYQIRRLTETGGAGFTRAFATTAEELSAILEARAVAGSKAEGARQSVLTMLAIMGVILVLMLSAPSIRTGYASPTAQLIAAVALAMMGFGYLYLNSMIADALEG